MFDCLYKYCTVRRTLSIDGLSNFDSYLEYSSFVSVDFSAVIMYQDYRSIILNQLNTYINGQELYY